MNSLPVLHATLLGELSMRCSFGENSYQISEQDSTSKRMWAFLGYLLTFHKRNVTQEELIDVLWGDTDITTPVNTLKTLLHRCRLLLESLGFSDGKQVLLYHRGVYSWNPQLQIEVDIDLFDEWATTATSRNDLDLALKALQIYQGDFLPNASGSPWTVSLRTYYHTRYLRLSSLAASLLKDQERYQEAADLCRRATTIDPYDESCHLLLMQCLAAAGSRQVALQHYIEVSNLFMDQLGVVPSEELTTFYKELSKSDQKVELDLKIVQEGLVEPEPEPGAFFCEYPVFQDIYRLECRSARRYGKTVQLAMITVLSKTGSRLSPDKSAPVMEQMKHAIMSNLRSGDVFTRFSHAQYLILLPTANRENGTGALQRVLSAFRSYSCGSLVSPAYELLPMLPCSQNAN